MPLADLDQRERDVVRQCLHAAVEGPFFPDWGFQTLFGLERNDVRRVLRAWPEIDETDQNVIVAINNSFNNLLGYPTPDKDKIWPNFIAVDGMEVARTFDKWKGRTPRTAYKARDYFDDFI